MRKRTRWYVTALPSVGHNGLKILKHSTLDGQGLKYDTRKGWLTILRQGDSYVATINEHSFSLSLTTTQAGYGLRYWYVCLYCQRRCARLYIGSKHIACRKCFNLYYASQSEDNLARMYRLIRSKRRAIGSADTPELMNLFKSSFEFEKPKGMRWETFERKRNELRLLEEKYWNTFVPMIDQVIGVRKFQL